MIIRTDKLAVGYGKKTVVSDINLSLLEGQFVCLLGPNGSGKSTILKTLVRMLTPLGGEVYLNEKNLSWLSNQEIAKTTAVVLTDPITSGLLTVYDIVMLGRHPHTGLIGKPSKRDNEIVVGSLKNVKAEGLLSRFFSELSDGEKQKVLLARALAQEPKLIVLDEPTSHLDARHRIEVMLILRQLTQQTGMTVVASLHDVDLALKVCDVAILIKNEMILACGTPEDVLHEEIVANLYGLEHAYFSARLGGIELKAGPSEKTVLVVAGAGSGASIYRALTRQNIAVITGILSENDIDFHIAQAIGVKMVTVPAYESINAGIFQCGCQQLKRVKQVIDAGFPVGQANLLNVALISCALDKGLPVHTIRQMKDAQNIYGPTAAKFIYSQNYFELISGVRRLF